HAITLFANVKEQHLCCMRLYPYTTLFRPPAGNDARGGFGRGERRLEAQPAGDLGLHREPRADLGVAEQVAIERVIEGRCGHPSRSEEHTSELQSREKLVCRLLLRKKKKNK